MFLLTKHWITDVWILRTPRLEDSVQYVYLACQIDVYMNIVDGYITLKINIITYNIYLQVYGDVEPSDWKSQYNDVQRSLAGEEES